MKGISVTLIANVKLCANYDFFLGLSLCEHIILKIAYNKPWKHLEQWEFEASMWQKKDLWV